MHGQGKYLLFEKITQNKLRKWTGKKRAMDSKTGQSRS
jgi:hypothetical protein